MLKNRGGTVCSKCFGFFKGRYNCVQNSFFRSNFWLVFFSKKKANFTPGEKIDICCFSDVKVTNERLLVLCLRRSELSAYILCTG